MNTVTLPADTDWTQLVCPLRNNATDTRATINISNLCVQYRTVEALRNISCNVKAGRVTGIIGPNGAGKSTLLKAMLGLIPVTRGRVLYNDKPLMVQLERVAYVPQR